MKLTSIYLGLCGQASYKWQRLPWQFLGQPLVKEEVKRLGMSHSSGVSWQWWLYTWLFPLTWHCQCAFLVLPLHSLPYSSLPLLPIQYLVGRFSGDIQCACCCNPSFPLLCLQFPTYVSLKAQWKRHSSCMACGKSEANTARDPKRGVCEPGDQQAVAFRLKSDMSSGTGRDRRGRRRSRGRPVTWLSKTWRHLHSIKHLMTLFVLYLSCCAGVRAFVLPLPSWLALPTFLLCLFLF